MIKVIAKATIKFDHTETFKKLASELVAETRKEAGCVEYQLFQDSEKSNVFTFIEAWESQEMLNNHMESKHFKEIIPQIVDIQEKDMEFSMLDLVI